MAHGCTAHAHTGRGILMRRVICVVRDKGKHGSDEERLANLDADVKEQQRDGN